MAKWTTRGASRIRHCLRAQESDHPRLPQGLTEEHRFRMAATIREHLKLCGWEFSKPAELVQ